MRALMGRKRLGYMYYDICIIIMALFKPLFIFKKYDFPKCFFFHKMAEFPWYKDVSIWLTHRGA